MQEEKYIDCPNKRIAIVNTITGETTHLRCKSYHCPYCGPIKITNLRKGIKQALTQWKQVRFWTFTLTSRIGTMQEHLQVLRESWRRFIDMLKKSNSQFEYIKIFEPHKSGYTHIHCFFSIYIDFKIVLGLWRHCVMLATKSILPEFFFPDNFAHCNVKGSLDMSKAINYISKYITKSIAFRNRIYIQVYSKSRTIIFFTKVLCADENIEVYLINSKNQWILLSKREENLIASSLSLEDNMQSIELALFPISSDSTEAKPTSEPEAHDHLSALCD